MRKRFYKPELHHEAGVAMLMALVTIFLLVVLAGELVYQSGVYSTVVFRQRDELRASLLARSGLRLARLQLLGAQKARGKAKSLGLGDNPTVVDQIWQTPLILPPPTPPGTDPIAAGELDAFRKSLGIEGTISSTILGANGRMSINGIVWNAAAPPADQAVNPNDHNLDHSKLPTPAVPATAEEKAKQTQKNITSYAEVFRNLLDKKRLSDDKFRDKYASVTGEQMAGNIAAWMDPNTTVDGDQRDKNDYYLRAEPSPYSLKNAPIASESEYHMIKGLDEELSRLVSENFTTQVTSSLDVNKASLPLLHSLLPDLTGDMLDRIDKRRTDESLGGPFKDAKDFFAFLNGLGFPDAEKAFKDKNIQVLSPETSYRVIISAQSGFATKTWLAEIGPLPPKVDPTPVMPNVQATATSTSTSTNTSTGTTPADSSDMDSLSIVYLKTD